MRLLLDDFAENRDPRQTCADAIVQIGCNLRADPFDGNRPSDPRAVDDQCQSARTDGGKGEHPSPLPERREHGELNCRRIGGRSVREDCADEKPIIPRRRTGERNRPCVCDRPVTIDAFELMLISQPVCALRTGTDEIDFDAAIAGLNREFLEVVGTVSPRR